MKNYDEIEVFTRDQVISMATGDANLRDRALLSVLYLTNSRVSEIVKRLQKKQIAISTHKRKRFLIFMNLHTSKNRKHPKRIVPVRIDKEKDLVNVILEYCKNFLDDEFIFPISRQWAWKLMVDLTGYGNHFQRHTRDTHLIVHYNIRSESLRRLNGWTDMRPLSRYEHLRWKDVADQM